MSRFCVPRFQINSFAMKFIQEVSNLIIKHKAVSDCGRQEGKSFLFHNIALLDDGLEELASGFEPGEPILETFQL